MQQYNRIKSSFHRQCCENGLETDKWGNCWEKLCRTGLLIVKMIQILLNSLFPKESIHYNKMQKYAKPMLVVKSNDKNRHPRFQKSEQPQSLLVYIVIVSCEVWSSFGFTSFNSVNSINFLGTIASFVSDSFPDQTSLTNQLIQFFASADNVVMILSRPFRFVCNRWIF